MNDKKLVTTDRSRMEAYMKCPALRWWGYEWEGWGIEKGGGMPVDLAIGSGVHRGIELLVKGMALEQAIEESQAYFQSLMGLDHEGQPRWEEEDRALVEALIRLWAMVVWGRLVEKYEILGVELEEELDFTGAGDSRGRLFARLDLWGRRRGDGGVVVFNFKTVGTADPVWTNKWQYDLQMVTETLALEQRLGEPVMAVVVQGLLKGRRSEYPKDSGQWTRHNDLIYGWREVGEPEPLGVGDKWHQDYKWRCESSHKSGGKTCSGGKNHNRVGAVKAGVWKGKAGSGYPGGIKAWMEGLAREKLEEYVLELPAVMRSERSVVRARRLLAREIEIKELAGQVRKGEVELDEAFPMHTHDGNCIRFHRSGRPVMCPMHELCHGGAAEAPLEMGFGWRQKNHPGEEERGVDGDLRKV